MAFDDFWKRYPRHEAKKDARKAWGQVKVDEAIEAAITTALEWQVPKWEQDNFQFAPLPASYLRGERWEDEPPAAAKPKASAPSGEEVSRFQAMRALRVSR